MPLTERGVALETKYAGELPIAVEFYREQIIVSLLPSVGVLALYSTLSLAYT